MKKTRIDATGATFGRLTIIGNAGTDKHGNALYRCLCECGNETVTRGAFVRSGHTRSCGCLNDDNFTNESHGANKGGVKTSTYGIYLGIKQRCFNRNNRAWKYYGGRGITMCDRWRESYEAFLADMGERPDGLTVERINNDGNYEPDNCRWATMAEQSTNKRARGTT